MRRSLLPLPLALAPILALGLALRRRRPRRRKERRARRLAIRRRRRFAGATPGAASAEASASPSPIRFEEIGAAAGARYLHHPRKFAGKNADVLEMFTEGGATVAVGDYDGDGDLDLFLTDSGLGRPNHLLRNQLAETGALRFVDVAAEAGVAGGNDAARHRLRRPLVRRR